MAEDESGSRWRRPVREAPMTGCLYCTAEHSQEERGMVALISAIRGHLVRVKTPAGAWLVPREYLDLHHFEPEDLSLLATVFDWSKID